MEESDGRPIHLKSELNCAGGDTDKDGVIGKEQFGVD